MTVETTEVGGAQEPRRSSPDYGNLTQPIAKDGDSVRESDTLRENGKGVELMGRLAGKFTDVDSPTRSVRQQRECSGKEWLNVQRKL